MAPWRGFEDLSKSLSANHDIEYEIRVSRYPLRHARPYRTHAYVLLCKWLNAGHIIYLST